VGQRVSLEETAKIKRPKKLRIIEENHQDQVIPVIFVFCCRKRYSLESLAAQWIQGFAQLVFLFFCAFLSHFRTPI